MSTSRCGNICLMPPKYSRKERRRGFSNHSRVDAVVSGRRCVFLGESKSTLWRVGRGREPWEQSEAGGVNDNERHLHHSPVSSPTEELRKDKKRERVKDRAAVCPGTGTRFFIFFSSLPSLVSVSPHPSVSFSLASSVLTPRYAAAALTGPPGRGGGE